ncbi:hypothetical protein [Halalkalibacter urbisdiaboli]|uniref:hypothetical protein n=1 Tax=Halalkalibacter urbisdiaboli TaxID=1960589 RepID=UPI000B44945D|nr:hypothetical protein [Halalkalibacter urbisdiaboli]
MSNNLDEIMGKLKKQYDEMPTVSSSERIMSQIKKEVKPKRRIFFRHWQAVAMIVAAIGIGSVLTLNQLDLEGAHSNSETSDTSSIGEATALEVTETEEEEQFLNRRTEEENDTALKHDVETDESSENEAAIFATGITEHKEFALNKEGQDETITAKRVSVEQLGFVTYVDEKFEVDPVASREGYALQIFANFGGGRIEPPILTVTEYTDAFSSVAEVLTFIREENKNYDITEDKLFTIHRPELISEELMVLDTANARTKYVAVIEREGRYFILETTLVGELEEAFHAHLNYMLTEFTWSQ